MPTDTTAGGRDEDPFEPGSVRRALAATFDAVVLTDDEGTIRHVGPGSGGAFGYPSDELGGRAIGSLLGDALPTTFDGPVEERECDLVDAEGRTRTVLVSVRGVEAGNATRLYAVRDVTARRSRERRFESLLERSTDAMSVLDEAGVVTYGSPANERIFGYAPASLVGEPALSVVHPDDAARVDEALSALLDDPEEATARIEYRGRHADGSWRWVESSVHVCEELPEGSLVVSSRDVTDRVERARRLEAAREARSFALQGAGAGIWEWEAGTGDLRLDESCERLFGLEPGGFDGRIETALEYVHPDDVAEMRADLERALGLEVDHVPRSIYRIVREDGVERWIESRAKLLTDDAGDPVRLLGVLVDITERQERLRQLRVLGRVLRHNLRNDLNVIRGHAELVASIGAAPATQCADRILRQSDRLLETADKERDITGVLATTPNREPIDLSPVVDRVVESARAEFPDARLSVDRPATATAVATDRIDALLGELVENALEHADRDPPTVDVRVTVGETSVEVRVADDGPGVPEMDREVVRGTGEVDPLFHGSGLGLWLVAWIGRRSGVTVRFEENDPRGTVVRVDVPRSGTNEDADGDGQSGGLPEPLDE
jgi:PAS domain S-box-containing protein